MATIKAYTDLEQSKKLAKILPLDSADMHYWLAWRGDVSKEVRNTPKVGTPNKDAIKTYWCSCWSLASLLGVLPILDNRSPVISKTFDGKYRVTYHSTAYEKAILTSDYDNPVDACVDMIEKLHELKML